MTDHKSSCHGSFFKLKVYLEPQDKKWKVDKGQRCCRVTLALGLYQDGLSKKQLCLTDKTLWAKGRSCTLFSAVESATLGATEITQFGVTSHEGLIGPQFNLGQGSPLQTKIIRQFLSPPAIQCVNSIKLFTPVYDLSLSNQCYQLSF